MHHGRIGAAFLLIALPLAAFAQTPPPTGVAAPPSPALKEARKNMRTACASDGRHDLPYEDVDNLGAVGEAPYRRLMYLYSSSGNRAAMVRTYQRCAAVLERELGVGPGPATRMVYEQLAQPEQFLITAAMERARNSLETPSTLHSDQV